MNRTYFILIVLVLIFACKTDKKAEENNGGTNKKYSPLGVQNTNTFEKSILDLRIVNKKFNDQYRVEKFGMLKNNDSIYSFVFKLDNNTTEQTVEAFSMGIRIFDATLSTPLNLSFNPVIENIEGGNYLILSHKLKGVNYFDSLDVYIYKRKDWNSSGRLGQLKIKDVLFE